LKEISAKEDIFACSKTFRQIINHWQKTDSIGNKESLTRAINQMKLSEN